MTGITFIKHLDSKSSSSDIVNEEVKIASAHYPGLQINPDQRPNDFNPQWVKVITDKLDTKFSFLESKLEIG